MKYNPDYHSSVVANLQDAYHARHGHYCSISDLQTWAIYGLCNAMEGDASERLEYMLQDMFDTAAQAGKPD